jgi:signal transduction histidine kinase
MYLPLSEFRSLLNRLLCVWLVALCFVLVLASLQLFPCTFADIFIYSFAVRTLIFVVVEAADLTVFYPDFIKFTYSMPRLLFRAIATPCAFITAICATDYMMGQSVWGFLSHNSLRLFGFVFFTVLITVVSFIIFEQHRFTKKAQKQLLNTHLTLLSSQLESHMLFNTMATLRALIEGDTKRALTMLDALNNYLRAMLKGSREQWHSVSDEFARLDDYLSMMSIRMGKRLSVTMDCPEMLAEHPIPPLLLQPLVENAIKHGLEPAIEGGELHIQAKLMGEQLILTVSDTGLGGLTAERLETSKGFGLVQIRERLKTIYCEQAQLSLVQKTGYSSSLQIHLPWRESL